MNYEQNFDLLIPNKLKKETNNNSRYFYNNESKELVFDIIFNTDSENKPRPFNLKLPEPLIIDTEHDIFLDSVVTYNLKSSKLPENMAFLLFIDEFNIKTKVATNFIKTGNYYYDTITTTSPTTYLQQRTNDEISNKINQSIVIPNEKSHETVEILASSGITGSGVTVTLPPTALGTSSLNYYKNFTIIIHFGGNSFISSVTSSTGASPTVLTIPTSTHLNGGGATLGDCTADVELYNEHNNHSTIHKGRKHNYVGTITPSKLSYINGIVSDMGTSTLDTIDGETKVTVDPTYDTPPQKITTSQDITYGDPFYNGASNHGNYKNIGRMIVEFKLVPRE